jgi:hypothetical protein
MNTFAERFLRSMINGKGIGLLLVLLLSLILSVMTAFEVKTALSQSVPYVQNALYEIAPIEVKNGTVVVPSETVQTYILYQTDDGETLPLVIDTTTDRLEHFAYPTALYLTRTAFYTVTPQRTEIVPLAGDFTLSKKDYTADIDLVFKLLSTITGLVTFFSLFCGLLLLNVAASLMIVIAQKATKVQLEFGARMRLNAHLIVFLVVLNVILARFSLAFSNLSFVLLLLILQILILRRMSVQTQNAAS